jgi:hypothetical protein
MLMVFVSWCFIEIVDQVFEGDTHALDEFLLKALRDPGNLVDVVR